MALSALQLALIQAVNENGGEKVYELSIPSFMDGEPIKMRALTSKEYFRISKQCTRDGQFNALEFRLECIAASLIDPDFNDAQFRDALKCPTASQAVIKVFDKPGVLEQIMNRIEEISGMGDSEAGTFRESEEVYNEEA